MMSWPEPARFAAAAVMSSLLPIDVMKSMPMSPRLLLPQSVTMPFRTSLAPGPQWSQRPNVSLVCARATCGKPTRVVAAAPAVTALRKLRRLVCSICFIAALLFGSVRPKMHGDVEWRHYSPTRRPSTSRNASSRLPLHPAGETGHIVLDEERVHERDGDRAEQRPRHELAP